MAAGPCPAVQQLFTFQLRCIHKHSGSGVHTGLRAPREGLSCTPVGPDDGSGLLDVPTALSLASRCVQAQPATSRASRASQARRGWTAQAVRDMMITEVSKAGRRVCYASSDRPGPPSHLDLASTAHTARRARQRHASHHMPARSLGRMAICPTSACKRLLCCRRAACHACGKSIQHRACSSTLARAAQALIEPSCTGTAHYPGLLTASEHPPACTTAPPLLPRRHLPLPPALARAAAHRRPPLPPTWCPTQTRCPWRRPLPG